ncbi:MAG: 16S rRNA pseudouridine(516) synthase [Thiobacillus sp.]
MTLLKAMQSQGFGTRKECERQIRAGEVAANGEVCTDPDAEFSTDGLELTLDGVIWLWRAQAYVVLHKPAGYECSHQPRHHPGIFSLLPQPLLQRGVQCVGRLDQDTTGLLLLSDDGQFLHRMTSPKKGVAKVYRAICVEPVSEAQCETLRAGVVLHDSPAPVAALACERVGNHTLHLTLAEGKYHQVKRMIAAAGNHVAALHRLAIGDFSLPDDLPPGAWRWLDADALQQLQTPWQFATS